jgi:FkbM family methyltransferase
MDKFKGLLLFVAFFIIISILSGIQSRLQTVSYRLSDISKLCKHDKRKKEIKEMPCFDNGNDGIGIDVAYENAQKICNKDRPQFFLDRSKPLPVAKSHAIAQAVYMFQCASESMYPVQQIITDPPFTFSIIDWQIDKIVSDLIKDHHVWERDVGMIFREVLQEACATPRGGLFVDVGANLGYFSVYSAVMGCKTISFEPQSRMMKHIIMSMGLNGVPENNYKLYNSAVSDETGGNLVLQDLKVGNLGGIKVSKTNSRDTGNTMTTVRLDDVVKEDVLMLKIDVEGHEPNVIRSASKLFETYVVHNIIIEWDPSRFGKAQQIALLNDLVNIGGGYVVSDTLFPNVIVTDFEALANDVIKTGMYKNLWVRIAK